MYQKLESPLNHYKMYNLTTMKKKLSFKNKPYKSYAPIEDLTKKSKTTTTKKTRLIV